MSDLPTVTVEGRCIADLSAHIEPGEYALVRMDDQERVWLCRVFGEDGFRIGTPTVTPMAVSCQGNPAHPDCGWVWLVKEVD